MASRRPASYIARPVEDGGGRKSSLTHRPDHSNVRRSGNLRMSGNAMGGGHDGNAASANMLPNGSPGGTAGGATRGSSGVASALGGGADPTQTIRPAEPEPIHVTLRLRPQNKLENSKRGKSCVEIHKGSTKVTVDAPLEGEYDFSFDRVFGERSSQADVYDGAVAALARKTMDGLDTALVAFGQTGSGKTHTMMGTGWDSGLGRKLGGSGDHQDGAGEAAVERRNAMNNVVGDAATAGMDPQLTDKDGNKIPMELSENAGMIPRILRDLYQRMAEASKDVEFTVRVSYVEIYMEKVLDLLNPTNRSLNIFYDASAEEEAAATGEDGGGGDDPDVQMGGGVRIKGASELCCLNETDALALLARGNAYRKLSSNDMSTDSNRSHSVFMIRLEQKDSESGRSQTSRMVLADLAGSEMADKKATQTRPDQRKGNGAPSQKEAKMINLSFSSLNNVVKALVEQQQKMQAHQDESGTSTAVAVPYHKSKLTRVLRHAFGGRCSTIMILTGSPSSFSISETIATIRFGQKCRRVRNRPQICLDLSPAEYRKQLAASERRQTELMSFVKALAGECRSLKTEGLRGRLSEAAHRGPIWDSIDTILEESDKDEADGLASRLAAIGRRSKQGGAAALQTGLSSRHSGASASAAEVAALREELEKAEDELAAAKKDAFFANQARNKAESVLGEIQSEAAALRTQNENLSAEKKKNMQDLIDAKNEIQVLSQRKLEVEHNLRVSQFRENEATVFLRQFRRFYRRLLRNKAAQGTGSTSEITAKVPGVPDLNDLIDVDTLLLESGLIEEEELRDDAAVGTYRPSSQALLRSTSAAKKAAKEAAALEKAGNGPAGANIVESLGSITESGKSAGSADGEDVDESLGGSVSAQSILSGNASGGRLSALSITAKQQALQTPSGRLISMREKDLERDLLQMTERCIELQIALNEEKANVDVLTNRTGSLSKKRLAQEAISLRQALDRKTHDLQAIIWKMNELHLINKTYNEKMANREQHVTYLEENLVDLQNTNRRLISDQQEVETRLRSDLGEMKDLVDSMTIPLWQFGEDSTSEHCLASRVIVPVRGGPYPDGVNWMSSPRAEGGGHVSNGGGESDDDGGDAQKNRALHTERPSTDARKPTADHSAPIENDGGAAVAPSVPSHRDDKGSDGPMSESRPRDVPDRSDGQVRAKPPSVADEVVLAQSPSVDSESFIGGKDVTYQQRRFVHKLGPQIRNGVLKEGKKKRAEAGSVTSGSGPRRSVSAKARSSSARAASATSTSRTRSSMVAK